MKEKLIKMQAELIDAQKEKIQLLEQLVTLQDETISKLNDYANRQGKVIYLERCLSKGE